MRVANGSAYGLGIYTSESLSTPMSFAGSTESLFVCLGVSDGSGVKNACNGFFVFSEDWLVAPVLRVQHTCSQPPNVTPGPYAGTFRVSAPSFASHVPST